jgi:hypothetical protein
LSPADYDELKEMGLKKFVEKVYKTAALVANVFVLGAHGDKLADSFSGLPCPHLT